MAARVRKARKPHRRAVAPRRRIGFAPESERLRPAPRAEREYEGAVTGDGIVQDREDYE